MRRVRKLLCFLMVLMLLGTIQYKGHADMGDFAGDSDWDSGWDSSWDSSDDWSSSWDSDDSWSSSWDDDDDWSSSWDSDDSWSSSWDDDDDDDHYYWGGWTSDGGSSGGDRGGDDGRGSLSSAYLPYGWEDWTSDQWAKYYLNRLSEMQEEKDEDSALAGFFVLAAIVELIIIIRMKRKKTVKPPVQIPRTRTNQDAVRQVKEYDPGFDENAFKERVSHMYVELQKAWTAKDWEPMRAYLTDDLFNQLNKQLQGYIDRKLTNHVERIAVLDTTIVGYSKKDHLDYLTVRLSTRICDYVTSDSSGKIIRGSQDRELFMTYDWTLVRAQGVQTPQKDAEVHCPNCGAPLDKGASVRCPYCNSILYGTEYDWTLKTIKGISQRS